MNEVRTEEAHDGDHELGRDALILVFGGAGSERRHGLVGKEDSRESKRMGVWRREQGWVE